MNNLELFTGQYPVSKTLRFELIPIGKTADKIAEHSIISNDTALAVSYKKMKKTIDQFHKSFIDDCMSTVTLSLLDEYYKLYTTPAELRNDEYKKRFGQVKQALRKEITASFADDAHKDTFSILNKKELIQKHLKKWIDENKPGQYFDARFHEFWTYFSGYNKNRMNMYTDEEKSTAISFRLINENLPKFIDNIGTFKKVADSEVASHFPKIMQDFQAYINYNSLEEMFDLHSYSYTLTQASIDAYNITIGGMKEGNKKYQGLNEYINLYNQKHPQSKLPKFKPLFKQILSDRVSASWLPESFDTIDEMLDSIRKFYSGCVENQLFESVLASLDSISSASFEKIFVCNDSSINTISNSIFGNYGIIREALEYYYTHVIDPNFSNRLKKAKSDSAIDKLNKAKNAYISGREYHSVAAIEAALKSFLGTLDLSTLPDYKKGLSDGCIPNWFAELGRKLQINITSAAEILEPIWNITHDDTYSLTQNDKDSVKAFLDSIMSFLHCVKPLYVKPGTDVEKDNWFYGTFDPLYEDLQKVTRLYDMVRNFCTKKPFSNDKIQLTFDTNNGHLLNGWVDSKTDNSDNGTQYGGYLFRRANGIKEYDYYLGISAKVKLFRFFNKVDECDKSEYERLDYYQPKEETIYGSAYKGEKTYAEDKTELMNIIVNYFHDAGNLRLFQDVSNYSEKDSATPTGLLNLIRTSNPVEYDALLHNKLFSKKNNEIITNLKLTLGAMKRLEGVEGIIEKEYSVFTDIMADITVLAKTKSFNFFPVSQTEMNQATNDSDKPLFLFKISNKDLSFAESFLSGKRKSRGNENLHTMYFKALMSGDQHVYDIGDAKVFFRKKSLIKNITHPANNPIASKNPFRQEKSTFEYDLVKDKRYTEDKYHLHLSMKANYIAEKMKKGELNESVCAYLKNNPDVNIIGIDRGERHLLYISMIDRSGKVIKGKDGKYIQYSLNTITGSYKDPNGNDVLFETPYHTLLDNKEQDRQQARKDWGTIENIKELKEGYLSQVVHHISKLMVEYNAIVVLEDLNDRFKSSRKKVEKQVYQNFERALIQKLNYLVFKDNDPDAPGGVYHAYQLTDTFEGFKYLTKQTGFLFYIPAWNTSKIDPVTGFADLLRPKYKNVAESQNFFGRFDRISYNAEKQYFEFAFDYDKFTEKASGTRTKWVICTHGKLRYTYNRSLNNNRGGYEKIDVTAKMRALFAEFNIEFSERNMVADITSQTSSAFFVRLIKLLQVTLAMRYSCPEDKMDFILSPVMNEDGVFFDTEEVKAKGLPLPQDADANGAYNIARKGLMVLEQIDHADKYKDWSTKISNKDWLNFVQGVNGR